MMTFLEAIKEGGWKTMQDGIAISQTFEGKIEVAIEPLLFDGFL